MTTLPARMHAAYIVRCGPADSIRYGKLPVPAPGPTDVVVRVQAVAVNPVDTFVRSGAYPTPLPFPFVIGRDLAGTVEVRGEGVVGFELGDRVWSNSLGHAGRQGTAAEYAVVSADRLYRIPDGVDATTMAAAAHPAASAYLALVHGSLRAGETVLIAGAAGHVGAAATALATRAGTRVIGIAGGGDLDICRSLGAQTALDYHDPNLHARLHEAAPAGVDVHLDTSGHHDLDLAVGLLAPRGRVVLMAGLTQHPHLPVGALYTRDAQIVGFAISNATTVHLAAAAERLNQLLSAGALRPRRIEKLPLRAAAEAHDRLETERARGVRLVLCPPSAGSGNEL